jgi:hypothetical protein
MVNAAMDFIVALQEFVYHYHNNVHLQPLGMVLAAHHLQEMFVLKELILKETNVSLFNLAKMDLYGIPLI